MKPIMCSISMLILCSCVNRYSNVSGVVPNKDLVKNVASDLVSAFSQSQVTGNSVNLHIAKGDNLLFPLLERALREQGYSVNLITNTRQNDETEGAVEMSYQATNENEMGTYCLKINVGVICRLYSVEGKPLSALTVKGIKIKRDNKFVPTNLDLENPDSLRQVEYNNETIASTAATATTPDTAAAATTATSAEKYWNELLAAAAPAERMSGELAQVKPEVARVDERIETTQEQLHIQGFALSKGTTNGLNGRDLQWKETPGSVKPPIITNDELRNRILKYVDQMPEDNELWFIDSQHDGEKDQLYRARLIRHAERLNRMAGLQK